MQVEVGVSGSRLISVETACEITNLRSMSLGSYIAINVRDPTRRDLACARTQHTERERETGERERRGDRGAGGRREGGREKWEVEKGRYAGASNRREFEEMRERNAPGTSWSS